ncbi:MAG TPA: hypothetical protein VH079_18650 [Terriglobales bacterium]|jgi:integrase|nr:hypothetical protein [Terriglobales bacterium]
MREPVRVAVRAQQNLAVNASPTPSSFRILSEGYSTMLRSSGTDIKVQQELLRHANIQTTLNTYTQAVSDQKRVANSKVVEMVITGEKIAARPKRFANGSLTGAD